MCIDPTVLTVLSTATSVLGSLQQGQARSDAYEYQAEMDRRQAVAEKDAATSQAEKIRKMTTLQRGETSAMLAASGVTLDEGTPLVIDQDIANRGEQDAFTELLNGSRKADSLYASAAMNKSAAKNAKTAGMIGAGTSLLSAGSSVASGWKTAPRATGGNVPGGFNQRIG